MAPMETPLVSTHTAWSVALTVPGERAGLSRATISFGEAEFRNPSLETLLRIAFVLEMDWGTILQKAAQAAARKSR